MFRIINDVYFFITAAAAKERSIKNMAKYSIDQLLDKVEEYIDQFEFSLAQKFCQRALEMEPDNVRALETCGTLLLELGNMDGAKQVSLKCLIQDIIEVRCHKS